MVYRSLKSSALSLDWPQSLGTGWFVMLMLRENKNWSQNFIFLLMENILKFTHKNSRWYTLPSSHTSVLIMILLVFLLRQKSHSLDYYYLLNYSSRDEFLSFCAEDESRNIKGSNDVENIVAVSKEQKCQRQQEQTLWVSSDRNEILTWFHHTPDCSPGPPLPPPTAPPYWTPLRQNIIIIIIKTTSPPAIILTIRGLHWVWAPAGNAGIWCVIEMESTHEVEKKNKVAVYLTKEKQGMSDISKKNISIVLVYNGDKSVSSALKRHTCTVLWSKPALIPP